MSAKFDKWMEDVDLARDLYMYDLYMYGGGLTKGKFYNRCLSDEEIAAIVWHGDSNLNSFPGIDNLINEKEKGMSIYQVFFVHKENRSLSWEYVVTDSREAAVIKAFAEAELENIDDYHIEVEHCYSL